MAFKKAVAEGTQDEFLSTFMSWTDKISLRVDMGLFRYNLPEMTETSYTDEKKNIMT